MKRSEIAKAFRAAKPFLSLQPNDGKEEYICFCLDRAADQKLITDKQRRFAQAAIIGRLGGTPWSSVVRWLLVTVGDYEVSRASYQNIQDYRLRWLNSLIKEFSK